MPSLSQTSGSLEFYSAVFENISLPGPTSTDGGFTIDADGSLKSFSAPKLTSTGSDFNLINTTALTTLGLENLSNIDGSAIFIGAFANLSLPAC